MNQQSRWLNTFLAWFHKEVDASAYDAYQRAGNVVFDLMLQAEIQRQHFQDQGLTPWTTPLNYQVQYLCLWSAFTLQTLGDQLLSTDYRLKPSTAGYVPPLTAQQIEAFYQPIEIWLSCAYQAQQNPHFNISDLGVAIPLKLPQWLTLKEMINGKNYNKELERYLEGLINAAVFLSLHIKSTLALFEPETMGHSHTNHKLHQLHADAVTTQEYVMQLWGTARSEGIYDKIENGIRHVIEVHFLLGQLMSMPSLIEKLDDKQWPFRHKVPHTSQQTPPTPSLSVTPIPPADKLRITSTPITNIDIWCLTSPVARSIKEKDATAMTCLTQMWQNDLALQQTLRVQQEIALALARGYITVEQQDYFAQCPWSAIYLTTRPLIIAGDPLRINQRFTYVCDVDNAYGNLKAFGNRILRL